MSEQKAIEQTEFPLTVKSFADQLRKCGVTEGQTLLVHMAMSKLGWMVGGPEAIILGLLAALGPSGTLVMIANSNNNTDPSEWENPPVPQAWWQTVRDNMPAYNAKTTPTRGLGVVPELFRTWPGTIRSPHPAFSLAANGPQAAYLMSEHPVEAEFGPNSPLAKLYELDSHVLLLGVEHWNNTSLHFAEFQANYPGKGTLRTGSAMLVDGKQQWVFYDTLDTYGDDFGAIGAAFDSAHQIDIQYINQAEVRLFKQRAVVDFAVGWMEQNRDLRNRSE